MNTGIVILALVLLVPFLSLVVGESDYDDRDRRGWWPGARAR